MGPKKELTALEKYALDHQLALDVPVAWWRFCRLWVRIALAIATRPPGRRDVIVAALAGRRDEPDALRGIRRFPVGVPPGVPDPFPDEERKKQRALVEGGCHGG